MRNKRILFIILALLLVVSNIVLMPVKAQGIAGNFHLEEVREEHRLEVMHALLIEYPFTFEKELARGVLYDNITMNISSCCEECNGETKSVSKSAFMDEINTLSDAFYDWYLTQVSYVDVLTSVKVNTIYESGLEALSVGSCHLCGNRLVYMFHEWSSTFPCSSHPNCYTTRINRQTNMMCSWMACSRGVTTTHTTRYVCQPTMR